MPVDRVGFHQGLSPWSVDGGPLAASARDHPSVHERSWGLSMRKQVHIVQVRSTESTVFSPQTNNVLRKTITL